MQCPRQISLDRRKPRESSRLPRKVFESGQLQGKSNFPKLQEDTEDTISIRFLEEKKKERNLVSKESASVMQESLQAPRKKIWKDKLNTSDLDILTTKLSKTLEAGLTSREKVLKPFWDSCLQDDYKKLWLPTRTDCSGLVLSSSETSSNSIMGKSWFSITKRNKPLNKSFAQTSSPSLQFSLPEFTVSEVGRNGRLKQIQEPIAKKGKAKRGAVKCLKIRVFPSPEEKAKIAKMHDQARWFYNAALNICYNNHLDELKDPAHMRPIKETELRNLVQRHRYVERKDKFEDGRPIVYKSFELDENYSAWPCFPGEKVMHNRIARGAVISFARSLNAAISNLQARNIRKFEMHYRCKKDTSQITLFEDQGFPKSF